MNEQLHPLFKDICDTLTNEALRENLREKIIKILCTREWHEGKKADEIMLLMRKEDK